MENQDLTQKNESTETKTEKNKFKNESFPQINLKSFDVLIFNYSSNLAQKIFESLQNETDETIIEKKLIQAFNYDNTNVILIKKLKEKYEFEDKQLNDILELYKPFLKYDFKQKIFNLIKTLNQYDEKDILMKFDIQDSIINDTKELQELINQFNKEISFEKKEFFLWYYIIIGYQY